jgi:hypothetical protein
MEARTGSTAFLKKRSKGHLLMAAHNVCNRAHPVPRFVDKSFLLLFFKKEVLAFLPFP